MDHFQPSSSSRSTTSLSISSNPSPSVAMAPSIPYSYPFATSPDIIRSHQKDAYFSGQLLEQLSSLLRKVYGARFAHTYTSETRVFSEILYLGLTTLIGNRTLGEEYCDIVQVEGENGRLPALGRRAGYILSCILGPYLLGRVLPVFRQRIRGKLEANLRRYTKQRAQQGGKNGKKPPSSALGARVQHYILQNLDTLTSPSPIYALSLATFYFSGSYYHLSKRIWNLRYIFTRKVEESDQRVGYEVLGVLLVLQMAVQGYLHIQNTVTRETVTSTPLASGGTSVLVGGGVEVSLDPNAYSANNALLFDATQPSSTPSDLQKWTHTPLTDKPRYELSDEGTMAWIAGGNRKCTLCLEEMKDPSVTTCGHVFCWTCISDWAREKPECPLCRQSCLVQHVLPLRG
ncbi:Pex12 amino terminal region-domain-containing protein [Clohesyomyces aquaticus]|uniref:RING-type E3 ubiquitin transferase n=1 Tax=Clohesyomyces aquaticus TaxID=1231657 RepID=A0A1Y1ZPC2_9PLEO|nr:Pex12 amino terminal region-domain-containing protein [Clohesyomyces aquaticus]